MGRKKLTDNEKSTKHTINLTWEEWRVFQKHKLLKVLRSIIKSILENEENEEKNK